MEQIGPYLVESELGRGGMGVVYRVRHPAHERPLALKLILPRAANAEALARFGREALVMAKVNHPGVVRIHTMDRVASGPYMVTELIEGEELKARLARGPLPPQEAAQVLRALADAVAAIHRQGILHRDLKPSNVMLRPDGSPVVLDFGIAQDESAEELTKTGQLLGTPNTMSPEQAEGAKELIGPPTDVYGLGAVLYAALTGGGLPFETKTSKLAVVKAVLLEDPQWPIELNPATPAGLDAICRKAMAKEIADRYPTAEDLREDLDRFLTGRAPLALEALPASRGPMLAVVGALVLLVLLGGGAAAVLTREPTTTEENPEAQRRAEERRGQREDTRRAAAERQRQADAKQAFNALRRSTDPLEDSRTWLRRYGDLKEAPAVYTIFLTESLKRPLRLEGSHFTRVAYARFLADGKQIISFAGNGNGGLRLWDVASRRLLDQPRQLGHGGHALHVGADRLLFGARLGHPYYKLQGPVRVGYPNFLSTETMPHPVYLVDALPDLSRVTRRELPHRGHLIRSIALSPSGERLALGYQDGVIHVLDAKTLELLVAPGPHRMRVNGLHFFDERRLVSGSGLDSSDPMVALSDADDRRVCVWDLQAVDPSLPLHEERLQGEAHFLRPTPDGKQVLVGTHNSYQFLLFDAQARMVCEFLGKGVRNRTHRSTGAAFAAPPRAAAFSPDGKRLFGVGAIAHKDVATAELRVWHVESREQLASLTLDLAVPYSAEVSPDGRWLLTTGCTNELVKIQGRRTMEPKTYLELREIWVPFEASAPQDH